MINKNLLKKAGMVSVIAIVLDFFGHYFLSTPMEPFGYFFIKFIIFYVGIVIYLNWFRKMPVLFASIVIAGALGVYYNVLPSLYNFETIGIPLSEISFLGQKGILSGIYFGILHVGGLLIGFKYSDRLIK